jgi:hypothetical protein
MIELVPDMSAPQFGDELSECEDQSYFKFRRFVCAVLFDVFRVFCVPAKMSARTPG